MPLVALPPYHGGIHRKFLEDSVLTGLHINQQTAYTSVQNIVSSRLLLLSLLWARFNLKTSPIEYLIVEMILLILTASMQYQVLYPDCRCVVLYKPQVRNSLYRLLHISLQRVYTLQTCSTYVTTILPSVTPTMHQQLTHTRPTMHRICLMFLLKSKRGSNR